MNIRIEGVDQLNRKVEKLVKTVGSERTEAIFFKAANKITSKVQSNINGIGVVTGNLSRSPVTKMLKSKYHDQPRPSIAAIDRKVAPHAHLLEFGTSKMSPRPFFRPAYDSGKTEATNYVRQEIIKVIREGAR